MRQQNALMRFFFKIDPASLDDDQWVARALEADWIVKTFYSEYTTK